MNSLNYSKNKLLNILKDKNAYYLHPNPLCEYVKDSMELLVSKNFLLFYLLMLHLLSFRQ